MKLNMRKIIKIAIVMFSVVIIFLTVSLALFYHFWLYPRYQVPILTYHYFDDNTVIDGKNLPLLFVSPAIFERQMRYLNENGYNVISLDELVEGIKSARRFSHKTVVITIDDGHKSVYTDAYPILKTYGFPATVFLSANIIGSSPAYLTWEQVKQMSRNNIFFESHTSNHVYIPNISDENVLWDEISGSKELIQKHTKIPVNYFCYPQGGITNDVVYLIKKAGYKGACATNRGTPGSIYALNRISVRNSDPSVSFVNIGRSIAFWAKLSGYYNAFRKAR